MLTAILLTAALSSLLWWRTAEATSRQLASTINEQIVAAVRKEVSAIVDEARAAHTAIRTLFLQNVLDTREADKREFVFLSQLQSQATISWVAFGWPDGSFFAAHKLGDRRLEMMEISRTDHPGQRRVDEYDVVPGDIEFANRRFEPTDFRVAERTWFKDGIAAEGPEWFKVIDHPIGQRAVDRLCRTDRRLPGTPGCPRRSSSNIRGLRASSPSSRSAAREPPSSLTATASLLPRRTRTLTNCIPCVASSRYGLWRKGACKGRRRGSQGCGCLAEPAHLGRRCLRGRAHALAVSWLVVGNSHSRGRVSRTR